MVRTLARSLHRSLATSLDPFQQVQNELALLVAGLEIAQSPSSLDESEVTVSMKDELSRCQENLNLLRKMKVDYDSHEPEAQQDINLDELIEKLAGIRLQLSHFTTTLGFINTNRIRLIYTKYAITSKLTMFQNITRTCYQDAAEVYRR